MSFLSKLKEIFQFNDDGMAHDDYDEQEYDEVEEENEVEQPRRQPVSPNTQAPVAGMKKTGSININAKSSLQVVLAKPTRIEEATTIADHLKDNHTVVLNLEDAKSPVREKLFDFLSGVAYAKDGQPKRVAKSTYIITSNNVDVKGDVVEELGETEQIFS